MLKGLMLFLEHRCFIVRPDRGFPPSRPFSADVLPVIKTEKTWPLYFGLVHCQMMAQAYAHQVVGKELEA
jgi:hypothetical protein